MTLKLQWRNPQSGLGLQWRGPDQDVLGAEQVDKPAAVAAVIGPRGPSAADQLFEFTQGSPQTVWTVNHNLGRKPSSVRVLTVGGLEVDAAVQDVSDNQAVITFNQPQAGTALIL